MLLIFNKNEQLETFLDNNGDSCPYYDAVHIEQINGENTFQFAIPADHPDAQYVVEGGHVAFKDVDQNYQLFEINRVEDDHGDSLIRTVYCEHTVYELLDEFIMDNRPTDTSAYNALSDALAGTRWQVGNVDDLGLNSTNFYRENPISALQKILDTWNGEVGYRIEIVGNQVTGRYIDIFQRRGADTGKRFEYGKDIESVERTVDATNVKTALYGFGKGEEVGDGNGRRITFADVEWKVANGDLADKPLGQEWIGDQVALGQWGRGEGTRHRFGIYENPDIEDPLKLLEETWSKLQQMKEPLVSYKMTVADLELLSGYEHEAVRLGDTVAAIDKEFNPPIVTRARIMEIKRNLLESEKTEVTLGNFLPMITDDSARLSSLESRVHSNLGIWNGKYKPGDPIYTQWLNGIIDTLQNEVRSNNGYVYMTDGDGILVLDKPQDQNPTKAIQLKGGIIAIANSKDPITGAWNFRAFGTGDGFTADLITAGKLASAHVEIGNATSFEEGYNPSSKAEQSDLTNVENRVTTTETQLSVQAGQIALKVTQEQVDQSIAGIEVGGRNLLENSGTANYQKEIEETSSVNYTQYWACDIKHVDGKINVGDEITISFDIQMEEGISFKIYDLNGYSGKSFGEKIFKNIGTGKIRLSWTLIVGSLDQGKNEHILSFYNYNRATDRFIVEKIKIEKGNKATDWTPAPEDVQSQIDTHESRIIKAETSIVQNAEAITLKASKSEVYTKTETDSKLGTKVDSATYTNKMSQIDVSINGINQTVSSQQDTVDNLTNTTTAHTSQISTLDQRADSIEMSVQSIDSRVGEAEAELSIHADQIATKVTQTDVDQSVNNIKLGARNLILNSAVDVSTANYLLRQYTLSENFIAGQEYTFVIKGAVPTGQKFGIWMNNGSSNVGYATTIYANGVYFVTFKAITPTTGYENKLNLYNYPSNTTSATVDWVALYKGSKPVDWTPAPEDVQGQIDSNKTRITSAETSITQNAQQIDLKANQSTVDALGTRVTDAEAELTVQASQISSKVSTTDFNSYKTQTATEISSKVSNDELGTKITQNADSVKIAVGQIGGTNLIKNGAFDFGISKYTLQSSVDSTNYNTNSKSSDIENHTYLWFKNLSASVLAIYQYDISVKPKTKYALSFWFNSDMAGGVGAAEVVFRGQKSSDVGSAYSYSYTSGYLKSNSGWEKRTLVFTTDDIVKGYLTILHRGSTSGAFRISLLQLEEGENATAWSQHDSELKSSSFEVTDDYARFTSQDGSFTEFVPSSTGLRWVKGTTKKEYHYLSYIGTGLASTSGVTITLPDEFKGKDFKVALSLREFDAGTSDHWVYKIALYVSNYDTANGKFTVKGYGYYGYNSPSYNYNYGYLIDAYGNKVSYDAYLTNRITWNYTGFYVQIGFDYVVIA